MSKTAYLALENGKIFTGKSFGKAGKVTGELVFNTGMVGYLELLSDISYSDKIVVQTFPLIGNYGVISEDLRNTITPVGYIVKHWCQDPSNFRNEGNIDAFLLSHGVVGLCDIDTRALTKIIRDNGSMRVMITDVEPTSSDFAELKQPLPKGPLVPHAVAETKKHTVPGAKYHIAVFDMGDGKEITRKINEYGADVTLFHPYSEVHEVLEMKPDGVVITDGASNPCDLACAVGKAVEFIKSGTPILAIGLSHQTFALAAGGTIQKTKYGHNGGQAVRDTSTGRTYITRQSHQYIVDNWDDMDADVSFMNINDGTCEGFRYRNAPVLTTQFTPDIVSGEHGTGFVFDRFIQLIEKSKTGKGE
ncbi:MAG: carbamoyl phosphate synthase small subunit [Oscillospiraceae bacterium]|nr:carbamoyl phosphate synthase small subunit [Oscillospiraceae bacterium]